MLVTSGAWLSSAHPHMLTLPDLLQFTPSSSCGFCLEGPPHLRLSTVTAGLRRPSSVPCLHPTARADGSARSTAGPVLRAITFYGLTMLLFLSKSEGEKNKNL